MASRFGEEAGIARDCYELGLMTLVGRFDSAIRMAQRVVQNLERINHPHTTGYALGHIACFLTAAEIEPLGTEISLRCIETSERDGMPLWVALGEASLAVSNTYRGEAAAAVPELRRGLDALSKVNFNVFRTLFLPSYVIGLAESGDLTGAAVELAEARELVEQNGAAFFEAEIYRAEGRLALMQNHLIPAEASYEHALNRAQQLGHLTWELRAALDLFRLFRATGRGSAGRDLLSSVLSKFEEGHSLPLLRRAAEALG